MTTSKAGDRGFTLIEVLMAMLVLTVGLLGLLQSVNISYEHNLRKRLREEAVVLAEEHLNDLRVKKALASFTTFTTATRVMGGVTKSFAVTRSSLPVAGDTVKLTVAVRWGFKNVSTTHEIYTIRKK